MQNFSGEKKISSKQLEFLCFCLFTLADFFQIDIFHFFKGPGPFPAVINMYGGINRGQVIEDKSAMFASRGIASLALAFFGVPDLPKKYVQ